MQSASLAEIVRFTDRLLQVAAFKDYERAANGLQVANRGRVTRLAAAVDGNLATVRLAAEAGADLLLVHHGLFWSSTTPWTGPRYEMLRILLDHNLAVYSSHLPLDAHPRLGNNAGLAAALGFSRTKPCATFQGQPIGCRARARIPRQDLAKRLTAVLGRTPVVAPGGPQVCRQIAIVSGGAADHLREIAAEGADTLITGEGPHWTYGVAEEIGLNVFYGGHYATETFGVKALAAQLSRRFRLPWAFLDHPTGL